MGTMGSCAAGKKANGSGCVDPADDPGREPGRQNAHEKHEQGIFVPHRANELRALLRGAPGHEPAGEFGGHAGLLVVLHHGDGARDAAVINIVAVAALAPRGGEAGGNVARHDDADLDAEGAHLTRERERGGPKTRDFCLVRLSSAVRICPAAPFFIVQVGTLVMLIKIDDCFCNCL